jgi:hypothetical protein
MHWVPILLLVIITLRVSGSLSAHHQELLSHTTELVQFMQLGDRVLPGSGRNVLILVGGKIYAGRWPSSTRIRTERPDPGSNRSPSCINCTNAVVRLRSSWWWSKRLPETCRLIIFYYYRYTALGPVWAETRAQSGDWYGSGTLHPGQILRGSLPLLSPRLIITNNKIGTPCVCWFYSQRI